MAFLKTCGVIAANFNSPESLFLLVESSGCFPWLQRGKNQTWDGKVGGPRGSGSAGTAWVAQSSSPAGEAKVGFVGSWAAPTPASRPH